MMDLKIPYAYINSNNNFVSAKEASKGQDYFCPKCNTEIILKKGKIRTPHFAHKPDTVCTVESIIHVMAKNIICDAFNRSFKIGKSIIGIKRVCPDCKHVVYARFKTNDIRISHRCYAATEVDLHDAGIRPDVGIYQDLELQFAIEIHNTNRVTEERADRFLEAKLPFIEVEAQDVIDEHERLNQALIDSYHLRHTQKFDVCFQLNPIRHNLASTTSDFKGLHPEIIGQIKCPKCTQSTQKE